MVIKDCIGGVSGHDDGGIRIFYKQIRYNLFKPMILTHHNSL